MKYVKTSLHAIIASILFLVPVLGKPGGGNTNPVVAPISSKAFGKSYGEWAQTWWTWVVSIPGDENPLFVDTSEALQVGQTQQVFFLTGALDGAAHIRNVTVPPGTPLFFPVINSLWWASDDYQGDLETATLWALVAGFTPAEIALMTDEDLLFFIAAYSIQAFPGQDPPELSIVVDNRELKTLVDYRATSPGLFTVPDSDLFGGLNPETVYAADGYWMLLNPLSAGQHTIAIQGAIADGPFAGFTVDVTYHLTVKR